jgi:hypothetical protein
MLNHAGIPSSNLHQQTQLLEIISQIGADENL